MTRWNDRLTNGWPRLAVVAHDMAMVWAAWVGLHQLRFALAPAMRRALRPGGIAVLSGLLNHQAHQVRARYHAAGFRLLSGRRHAGWTVLALQRR